ncbi:DeoR/GlpR family DNA-binding transcription regulator [Tabrizicola sp. J26]|uniref:DeoR/GlpR family DNA-binding transcription regulator n=1 Tax=Alitabrizicola rongguiensis TaxID=2909234 RepID=UPI001F23C4BE|nr:DeoR/GlpR family DNA-binding transcription regulator [Tabrizicola rongguiensis]MCF1710485.1 DeoR/GlpR family DNA-binding transcription regulator [Tabrizicola rongguiensis]
MLTAQRKALLLSRLAAEGRLVAATLAAELGLSEDTIRRDLRELAAEGKLLRVHGGALPLSPTHRPLADRRSMAVGEKRRLAATAARLIRPGQVVILDGGTTHLELVHILPADLRATIVTHSPTIAAALEPFPDIEVILIGGRLFRHSMVAVGAVAAEGFAQIHADLCLLGVTGLHPERGLTTGDDEEAAIKRRMMAQAGETVVLATSDKLGASSPFAIAPLGAVGTLVVPKEARLDGWPDGPAILRA